MASYATKRPQLNEWQHQYIKRAARIRRDLSLKALARKFGVSTATIMRAQLGSTPSLEQWEEKLSTDPALVYKRTWNARAKNRKGVGAIPDARLALHTINLQIG